MFEKFRKWLPVLPWFLCALTAPGAERRFDFSELPVNSSPTGCVSIVAGRGNPGTWKVLMDDFPLALQPWLANAPRTAKKTVVAQVAEDMTDEHYPMLLLGDETYSDFKLTTKFKVAGGVIEQMAGLAFGIQDERNFYVARASVLGKNVSFYKMFNGRIGTILKAETEITPGVWHELTVDCHRNQIRCLLDGKQVIGPETDNTFAAGKIAYWTKSDSVSYFTDTRIEYTPREAPVQGVVREIMAKYPRLLGVQIVMLAGTPPEPRLVASSKAQEIGQPGRKSAFDVIRKGTVFYDKDGDKVTVTMPLRDRNGDSQAAVRVIMRSFKGQTEENAILRAVPIVKEMQAMAPVVGDWK